MNTQPDNTLFAVEAVVPQEREACAAIDAAIDTLIAERNHHHNAVTALDKLIDNLIGDHNRLVGLVDGRIVFAHA